MLLRILFRVIRLPEIPGQNDSLVSWALTFQNGYTLFPTYFTFQNKHTYKIWSILPWDCWFGAAALTAVFLRKGNISIQKGIMNKTVRTQPPTLWQRSKTSQIQLKFRSFAYLSPIACPPPHNHGGEFCIYYSYAFPYPFATLRCI